MLPLSHEMTAGRGTLMRAFPPDAGVTTESWSPKATLIVLDTDDQPRRSASPGPVEPAPVSAADLPQ